MHEPYQETIVLNRFERGLSLVSLVKNIESGIWKEFSGGYVRAVARVGLFLGQEYRHLDRRFQELERSAANLISERNKAQADAGELRLRVEAADKRASELAERLEEAQAEARNALKNWQQREDDNSGLIKRQISDAQIIAQLKQDQEAMEKDTHQARQTLAKLAQTLADLRHERDSLQARVNSLLQACRNEVELRKTAEAEAAEQMELRKKLEQANAELQAHIGKLSNGFAPLSSSQERDDQEAMARGTITALRADNEALSKALTDSRLEADQYKSAYFDGCRRMQTIANERGALARANDELRKELKKAEAELTPLAALLRQQSEIQHPGSSELVQFLQKERGTLTEKIRELFQQLQSANDALGNKTKQWQELHNDLVTKEAELGKMREVLKRARLDREEALARMEESQAECQHQRAERQKECVEYQKLAEQLKEARADLDRAHAAWDETETSHAHERRILRNKIHQLTRRLGHLEEEENEPLTPFRQALIDLTHYHEEQTSGDAGDPLGDFQRADRWDMDPETLPLIRFEETLDRSRGSVHPEYLRHLAHEAVLAYSYTKVSDPEEQTEPSRPLFETSGELDEAEDEPDTVLEPRSRRGAEPDPRPEASPEAEAQPAADPENFEPADTY